MIEREIILNTDESTHEVGNRHCKPCSEIRDATFPIIHEYNNCGGLIHAEYRYDMEIGGYEYLIVRCDKCNKWDMTGKNTRLNKS